MDQATLQTKIDLGRAKAASIIGGSCQQYRPYGPKNPTNGTNLIANPTAAFDVDPKFGFSEPSEYGKPDWYVLADGSDIIAGDYLISVSGTFFITSNEATHPIKAVFCNTSVSIERPAPDTSGATTFYFGSEGEDLPGNVLLAGWPASVINGTKGESAFTKLPGDTREQWVAVLLPAVAGVLIEANDIMLTSDGRRFIISAIENTPDGYRLTAEYAGA